MPSIKESLDTLLQVDGAMAIALVDSETGMLLGSAGGGIDLDTAAAGNTEVVRAKLKTIKALGLEDTIDDILISLSSQYHIIRPLGRTPTVFLYVVLDKNRSNLALARMKTKEVDENLVF